MIDNFSLDTEVDVIELSIPNSSLIFNTDANLNELLPKVSFVVSDVIFLFRFFSTNSQISLDRFEKYLFVYLYCFFLVVTDTPVLLLVPYTVLYVLYVPCTCIHIF